MLADEFLKSRGVGFQLIEQRRATFRCIDSAEERGVSTKQIVKSMIIKSNGEIVQCLVPGHLDLDEGKLASILGRFEIASEAEVKAATGQPVGTVHPYVDVPRKLMDERVLENETLSFTTGNPMRGIIITKEDFLMALGRCEVVDICSDPEEYLEELAARHGIQKHDAKFLVESEALKYFEVVKGELGASTAIEWLRTLVRFAGSKGKDFSVVKPEWLVAIVKADLTEFAKKEALLKAIDEEKMPGLTKEEGDLNAILKKILGENSKAVDQYKAGDERVVNFLVGQAMKASKGAFDPKEVRGKLIGMLNQK